MVLSAISHVGDILERKIKLIIAEDHKLMRNGYISVLKEREDYEIVGEAGNGKELLDLLKLTHVDVILLDLEMPVMTGGEAFEKIKELHPDVKTIIISSFYDDSYVTEYFLKGVNGYLSKGCDTDQLFEAIDTVTKDQYYFNTAISKFLLSKILKDKHQKNTVEKLNLTNTEMEILKMICDEKGHKHIADEMKLSIHTIEYHKRNILAKTQQSTVIGLVKFAIKNGITSLE